MQDFKLNELPYERLDIKKVCDTYGRLTNELRNAASFEEQEKVHDEYYSFSEEIWTTITLANIRRDGDVTDEFYEKETDFYDEVIPQISNLDNEYHKVLLRSPFRKEWEEKIGSVSFINMELSEKSQDEKILPLMQEENALVTRYEKLIATAKIPFKGEIYNLSLMSKFTTGADRKEREAAWKAIDEYFSSVSLEIDEIFDKLVKNRTSQAKELGLNSYTELGYMRMHRNCYDRTMVEKFRNYIKKDIVPRCNEINEKRRGRLEVDTLKLFDQGVYFKEGNPTPKGSPEEILLAGQKMYRELSEKTGEFFDFMQKHELFDVLGRKTKKAGGYMTYLPKYKAPFIFANFNATNSDIEVITHECGHAFQGYLLADEKIREFAELSMDLAEIHSMSMEYFTYDWMEEFFGDKAENYRIMHSEDSMLFLPYGCMVDEFQHIIYDRPFMSPGERKQAWKKLEEEYRPHIDFSGMPFFENGGYWQRQHHIFSCPFYYIDYVLAAICAMQFKEKMDENFDEAFKDYVKLCELSGRYSFIETLPKVGIKIPFEGNLI